MRTLLVCSEGPLAYIPQIRESSAVGLMATDQPWSISILRSAEWGRVFSGMFFSSRSDSQALSWTSSGKLFFPVYLPTSLLCQLLKWPHASYCNIRKNGHHGLISRRQQTLTCTQKNIYCHRKSFLTPLCLARNQEPKAAPGPSIWGHKVLRNLLRTVTEYLDRYTLFIPSWEIAVKIWRSLQHLLTNDFGLLARHFTVHSPHSHQCRLQLQEAQKLWSQTPNGRISDQRVNIAQDLAAKK